MKIVVLVKEVPDTWGKRSLSLETGLADRAIGERVLDEIGERAIEVALSYADSHDGTEVVVLSMGPEMAVTTLRKGLAMGADSAVHVVDEALRGADLGLTAQVLSSVLARIGFNLVIAGNLATDGTAGALPAMVAEYLELPQLTSLSSVLIEGGIVSGIRSSEAGTLELSAELPAVISVTEAMPEGRLPSFKGIMAAKKKPYEVLTLTDLAIAPDSDDVGRSIVTAVAERPPRGSGVKIVDEGDAGEKLAGFLKENRLV